MTMARPDPVAEKPHILLTFQNRDFQRQAEDLASRLHSAAAAADIKLASISSNLTSHQVGGATRWRTGLRPGRLGV